jgi:hypothetical protein
MRIQFCLPRVGWLAGIHCYCNAKDIVSCSSKHFEKINLREKPGQFLVTHEWRIYLLIRLLLQLRVYLLSCLFDGVQKCFLVAELRRDRAV